MNIQTWDINRLKENPHNARGIKIEDFNRLKKQIQKHGIYKPLLVNEEGVVIGGNMRLKAYRDLGITEVEVSIVSAKTEPEILALGLSDNDRAGYYEEQDLAELIQQYGLEIGLEDYKVDLAQALSLTDVLNQFAPDIEEDEAPAIAEGEPDSKLGEVYQLGRHRLMCGDATKIEDVEKLMDGQKADMVFTDPPYGMNLDTDYSKMHHGKGVYTKDRFDKVEGDNQEFNAKHLLDIQAREIFLWGADYYKDSIPSGGSWIVWDKRANEYNIDLDKVHGSAFELCWSKTPHKREIARILWSGHHGMAKDDTKERVHPTQKPMALAVWFYKKFSKDNDIIVDLYGGSGSFLIACEQTNRICYMMELDPKYVDVIRKRYNNYITNHEKEI